MSVARKQLKTGFVIADRYQVEDFLATGEMADSYRGRDLAGGKSRVVIKIINLIGVSRGTLSSLSREFSLLQRLRHASLARILDFGVIEEWNALYLVEEEVEGKDLYAGTGWGYQK